MSIQLIIASMKFILVCFLNFWDSIVFEGRASIDAFLSEIKRLGFINIFTLPFSYTDVSTLQYANKVGLHNVDHSLQEIIMKKDMVRQ